MPIRPFVLLTLTLVGCAHAAQRSATCPSIAGLDAVVKPGALVLFGEVHGTNEIPAFVGDAACAAARKGRVHVGLELPAEDAGLLRHFLAGEGDQGLQESDFWRSSSPYGVTSSAMLALLHRLREYRRTGAPIDVFFFDERARSGLERRDEAMAESISRERGGAPSDIYLVVVGNFHARKIVGAPWDPKKRWMASFLSEREPGLVTLDFRSLPGTAWTCAQTAAGAELCGSNPVKGSGGPAASSERAVKLEAVSEAGYDGIYWVGALTASPPAFPPRAG
jgi:hypothetical protein